MNIEYMKKMAKKYFCLADEELNDWYLEMYYDIVSAGFDLVEAFNFGQRVTNKFKCLKCGKIIEKNMAWIRNRVGNGSEYCIPCSKVKVASFSWFKEVRDKGFEFNDTDYVKIEQEMKFKCKKCGGEFLKKPSNMKVNPSCPECRKKLVAASMIETRMKRKKEDNIKIEALKSSGIEIISVDYEERTVEYKCNKGHIGTQKITTLIKGGCKSCNKSGMSKGEKRVAKYLDDVNIRYATQKKFRKCKYRNMLPFDFYIPSMKAIIEFDGEQHFYPVDFTSSKTNTELNKTFQLNFTRDSIKNAFCILNGYKLIRISYREINDIEKILEKELIYA